MPGSFVRCIGHILGHVQDSTTRYQLSQPGKWNAVELTEPLSPYETMSGLLVPLYAARAAEEAFYGPEGVTLSTSSEVSLWWHPYKQLYGDSSTGYCMVSTRLLISSSLELAVYHPAIPRI